MREARENHEEKQNALDKDKLDELLACSFTSRSETSDPENN